MKQFLLFFVFLLPVCAFAQFTESFDGPGINSANPWTVQSNFFTLVDGKLQLDGSGQNGEYTCYVPVTYSKDMEWQLDVGLNFKSSNYNNVRLYVYSNDDSGSIIYYIQIGHNDHNVSLYRQKGSGKPLRVINGRKELLATEGSSIKIKLTMEGQKIWRLYTSVDGVSFRQEGEAYTDNNLQNKRPTGFFNIICKCAATSSKNHLFTFDNIQILPEITPTPLAPEKPEEPEEPDTPPVAPSVPKLLSLEEEDSYSLLLTFDKKVNATKSTFLLNEQEAERVYISDDETILKPEWNTGRLQNTSYTLVYTGITAKDNTEECKGNKVFISKQGSRPEEPEPPVEPEETSVEPFEIVFNELLPNPFTGGSEYVELYNRSDRELPVTGLSIATRKADGTLSTRYSLSSVPFTLEPDGYLLLSKDIEGVYPFYLITSPGALHQLKLPILANTASTLVLFRTEDEEIIDEVSYSSKWHAASVKSEKGVALERIDPDAATQDPSNWTSASGVAGYGTPGYRNSQYKTEISDRPTSIEPPVYSDITGEYTVSFYLQEAGCNGSAWVFDTSGRRLACIANNILLASSGALRWNGLDDNGNRLQTGVYILYFSLYHPDGYLQTYKKAFLVHPY